MTNLYKLGFTELQEIFISKNKLCIESIARVLAEHREWYTISNGNQFFDAEITGNIRFSANSREDFPAVGDWVIYQQFDDNFAIINQLLPRETMITRKAIEQEGEIQLIATNIDFALIMQSVERDFNLNRLERYLTIVKSGKVKPIVLLSKTDLISESKLSEILSKINSRAEIEAIVPFSNLDGSGLSSIESLLKPKKTYCLLGSSGVGKSTLINQLLGTNKMDTKSISDSTGKGKHTTTHRELMILKNGALLIDTPGMREIGVTESSSGIEEIFSDIEELSGNCKFGDCSHTNEPGCAILDAILRDDISEQKFTNYQKLQKEVAHFNRTHLEKRKKDKEFGKMCKSVMSAKKKANK